MVETGALAAGGEGEGEGAALPTEASPRPPRPSISLPPRSSFESLFRDSGGGGGGVPEASPGPLTLVSSFFAEDPESESRSFTQLLAGAMNSPVAAVTRPAGIVSGDLEKVADGGGPESGSGLLWVGQHRPGILTVNQSQAFTIPPGLSPASLLDSPGLFSSGLGTFGTSHQEALAKVTEQVSSAFMTSSLNRPGVQEIAILKPEDVTFESTDGSHSDQRSQPTAVVVDKPAEDGYNWRKYGQKMVKGSEYPRSYYKCSHLNCPVKKKVEHSVDGQITEIIYKGHHNHQRPAPNKHSREGGSLPAGSNLIAEGFNNPARHESSYHSHQANLGRPNDASSATSASKRDREPDSENREQLSGSSDDEEASEMTADRRENQDADAKRRNVSDSSQRALPESKIIVQTTSEVDLLDDGYRWRKYGQKVVKGNPHPRSYYKCTYLGCNVRKHIERAASDPKAVITTYEGKHNHDVPASRSSKS